MGLRACSIKKYVVEFGDTSGFNYNPDTLANIFNKFCSDVYTGEDYANVDVYWEINKEEFANMIRTIEAMSDDEYEEFISDTWDSYSEEQYTKERLLKIFKGYLNDTPENSNYVRLGWV